MECSRDWWSPCDQINYMMEETKGGSQDRRSQGMYEFTIAEMKFCDAKF